MWTNSYRAPGPVDATTYADYGPEPYDVHFCFPLNLPALESDRVKLTSFIPRLHAQPYFEKLTQHPELSEYYPGAQPASLGELLYTLEYRYRRKEDCVAFAIIDKGRPDASHPEWGGSLAGFIALLRASLVDLSVEIGTIRVFPSFQRTYVTSHAIGLLIRYCLERPSASPVAGLGLRRVEWRAATGNEASIKAALRMGFTFEGVARSKRVVYNPRMKGMAPREGDPYPDKLGLNAASYSFCADDWEAGGRELVKRMVEAKLAK